jgi:hypothetical protein
VTSVLQDMQALGPPGITLTEEQRTAIQAGIKRLKALLASAKASLLTAKNTLLTDLSKLVLFRAYRTQAYDRFLCGHVLSYVVVKYWDLQILSQLRTVIKDEDAIPPLQAVVRDLEQEIEALELYLKLDGMGVFGNGGGYPPVPVFGGGILPPLPIFPPHVLPPLPGSINGGGFPPIPIFGGGVLPPIPLPPR